MRPGTAGAVALLLTAIGIGTFGASGTLILQAAGATLAILTIVTAVVYAVFVMRAKR